MLSHHTIQDGRVVQGEPLILSYATPKCQSVGWPLTVCGSILFISLLLQALFLPCLCARGAAKMNAAFLFDLAFILRFILARLLHQTDRGWIFYGVILLSSFIWIDFLLD